MTRCRGVALLLALVVLLAATAGGALALQWALLQLQLGRAWRQGLDGDVARQATAALLLRAGAGGVGHTRWVLDDSLVLVRVVSDSSRGALELLLQANPPPGSDTLSWRLVAPRGLLPLP